MLTTWVCVSLAIAKKESAIDPPLNVKKQKNVKKRRTKVYALRLCINSWKRYVTPPSVCVSYM